VPAIAAKVPLCSLDTFALARYCANLDEWQEDSRYIQEHGSYYTTRDAKGNVRWVESAVSKHMTRLARSLQQDERLFGIGPQPR